MSGLNPNTLKVISPMIIMDDRPCVKCGYNLLGLKVDGVCPECGRPIKADRKSIPRYSDNLINAPRIWLAGFALASTMLAFTGTAMFALLIIAGIFGDVIRSGATIGFAASTIGWYLAVVLFTVPRPLMPGTTNDPRKEWRGLRWASRITQFFWPVMAAAMIAWLVLPANTFIGTSALAFTALGAFIVAALGVFPLCIYISNVAFWADDEIGIGFRHCAWLIGAAVTLVILDWINIMTRAVLMGGFWASLIHGLLIFFVVAPEFYLFYNLWRLQSMARWALRNQASARAKSYRLRARAEQAAQQAKPPTLQSVQDAGIDPSRTVALAEDSQVNPASVRPERAPIPGSKNNIMPKQSAEYDPYDVDAG